MPASAAGDTDSLVAPHWAYTDSRSPKRAFVEPDGDVSLGARTDRKGVVHQYRPYATFDLSRLEGTVIHKASVVVRERSAAGCSTAQPVELWRTDPFTTSSSWDSPPRRRELLGTVMAGGEDRTCPDYLVWDLVAALQELVDDGAKTLTVEIAVPSDDEGDVTRGRVLRPSPSIQFHVNHRPVLERAGLVYPSQVCGTRSEPAPTTAHSTTLMAEGADADSTDRLSGEFAAWPVEREVERVTRYGSTFGASGRSQTGWDMSQYAQGTVVAWTARLSDGDDTSEWSEPCFVTIDAEPPASPQLVSDDYPSDGQPHGGQGIPGKLTFTANGSDDVVGYYWGQYGEATAYVAAPSPGADVTVSFTPTDTAGFESVAVRSVDRAGNSSERVTYDILVRRTAPEVTVEVGGVGVPSRLHLSTIVEGVTAFGYRVDDATEQRIPAGADGTAEAAVVFTSIEDARLQVSSYVGDRLVGTRSEGVDVNDWPVVESEDFLSDDHDPQVGRPGTFTFRPRRAGVTAYEYFLDEEWHRVEAAADGTAVVSWTPTESTGLDQMTIVVRSLDVDGTESWSTQRDFQIIDVLPDVDSSDYDTSGPHGGVGIPGEFELDTRMPDADAYVYRLNDGPEQTVDLEARFARIHLTPERAGINTLTVRTRFLDGSLSPARTYTFEVSDAPIVVSTDYPEDQRSGQPGETGRFTFRPGRPDVVEYRYTFDDGGEEQVVPAREDGTATVEITPTRAGYTSLTVTSRTADGQGTLERRIYFTVADPRIRVSNLYYDESTPNGGIGSRGTFGLSTELDEVSAYEYRFNDGAWSTLARASGALETDVSVTMDRNGLNVLSVRGRTDAGLYTAQTDYPFLVGTEPQVRSSTRASGEGEGDGAAEIVLSPGSPGVVAFEYSVDDGDPVVVAAGADGTATVTYTAPSYGSHVARVRGRTPDGEWTDTATHWFVAGALT